MEEHEFMNLKKSYLLDSSGKIRDGITMKMYAQILEAKDDDELDKTIQDIMATNPEVVNIDEFQIVEDLDYIDEDDDDYELDGE